jgi:hypothetical protein
MEMQFYFSLRSTDMKIKFYTNDCPLMGTDMETEKYKIISYIVQLEAQMSLKHSHGKEDIRNHCPS